MKSKAILVLNVVCFIIIACLVVFLIFVRLQIVQLEKQVHEIHEWKGSVGVPAKESVPSTPAIMPIEYQATVKQFVHENIENIVAEKHPVGGRWVVTAMSFLSADLVRVDYEDGHSSGQLILKIDSVVDNDIRFHVFWRLE